MAQNDKQIDKQDNKSKILDCALELFYEIGYEGVGVQEIAQSAGITKPTLYYYFKSKYGLLESVLAEFIPEFIEALEDTIAKSTSLEDTLNNVAKEYIRRGVRRKKSFYLFISLAYSPKESDSHKAVSEYTTRLFGVFKSIFTKNEKLLGNMNGRQEQFAMGFMGILNYYLLVHYEKTENEESIVTGAAKAIANVSDKEIYSIVHQFMHGIFS